MFRRYLLTGLVAGFLSISSTLYPVKLTDTRGVKEYVESFLFNGVYAAESEIILKDNTTASGLTVKEETANTTIARFRGDGNVGIGTTVPGYKLHVVNNADGEPTTIFENDQADANEKYTAIRLKDPSNWYSEIRGVRPGALAFATNDTTTLLEKMRILGNGNVGIGTTAPLAKLDVNDAAATIVLNSGTAGLFSNNALLAGQDTVAIQAVSSDAAAIDVGGAIGLGGKYNTTANNVAIYGIIVGSKENSIDTNNAGYLAFRTRADSAITTEKMRITSAGNVGIGTTAPTAKLEVAGDVLVGGATASGKAVYAGSGDHLTLISSNAGGAGIRLGSGSPASFTERMRIDGATGNVGIGTTSPQHPLHMGSGAHVTTGGVWTNASSREYKKNIRDLTVDDAMQTLDGLRPSRFNYKVDDEDEYVGFIAEDVPELVATRDRKGLSPMDLTAVITKVVQEQQRMLQDQKETIDAMKQEIEILKTGMNYGVKGL